MHYPQFLYSDTKHPEHKGPYVLHTHKPRFLCRVGKRKDLTNEDWTLVFNGNLMLVTKGDYFAMLLNHRYLNRKDIEEKMLAVIDWYKQNIVEVSKE